MDEIIREIKQTQTTTELAIYVAETTRKRGFLLNLSNTYPESIEWLEREALKQDASESLYLELAQILRAAEAHCLDLELELEPELAL